MEKIQFKCELLSDIVLNDSSATEGKRRSLDFIPGNNFLGIVAAQLYNETNDSAWHLFHSGNIRFGDAHPSADNKRGLRIPASIYHPKLQGMEDSCYIHHLTNHNDKEIRGMQLKQCREGFYIYDQNEMSATEITVNKDFSIKSAYDSDMRRSKDSQMFGYEALCKGLIMYFTVEIEDESKQYKDEITKALSGHHHIGRSRSAQYGWVEITESKFEEIDTIKQPTHIGEKQYVTIYADSRLIFLDDNGNNTFQPCPKDLGIEDPNAEIDWTLSQIRTFQYAPWNYKRQAFDADRCGIEKGSVFIVMTKADLPTDKTVGCYQNEGFGHIIYNPIFLQGDNEGHSLFRFCKQEEVVLTSEPSEPNSHLIQYLLKKQTESSNQNIIITEVNKFVETYKDRFSQGIFASQWGSIRALAMVYDNEEELKKVIGCSDSEKGYINHGVAAEKWNERGRKEILVNFLEDSQLEGKLQEAVINLASEMAKICKS
jgi:hypothetical protein